MKKINMLLISCILSGCAVGSDYLKPDINLPQSWFAPKEKELPITDDKAEIEQSWWKNFNDPVLGQLIEKASADNFDLKITQAKIAQARAMRGITSSALIPQVNMVAGDMRQGNRFAFGGAPFPGMDKPFNTFQAGFDASWELDLFGKSRRALEAANAELESAIAARDAARVSMFAEIASTYMDIRSYQQQLKITQETIDAEKHTVSIVNENYRAGNSAQLYLMQARAQLEQTKTQLPYYQNLLAQSEYSMDVLLGQQPGTAYKMLEEEKPIPAVTDSLLLSTPAKVIAERPDIRVAESNLAAATARQGVAAAQFFPDISLSAFVGFLNVDAEHLLERDSKSWSLGGNILSPILNYGKLSSNMDLADAKQQEALAVYQKAVISALSDVSKSVAAYKKQQEYLSAVDKTVSANRKTADIARSRYKEGLSSFIEVLDAERTLYNSQSQQVKSRAQVSKDMIAVYKSLGGGWK